MPKQSKLFLSLELLQNFCPLSFKDIQSMPNFRRGTLLYYIVPQQGTISSTDFFFQFIY